MLRDAGFRGAGMRSGGEKAMNPLDSITGTIVAGVVLALVLTLLAGWLANL
jgi:hypothetical protein